MTDEELDDLADRSEVLASIAADLKRARTAIRALAAVCVALVIVIIGVALLSLRVSRNSRDIATVQDVFTANCESGNEFRAGERELWGFIFEAQSAVPRTPEQQKQFDDIKAIVDRIFARRDCSELPATPAQP